MSDANQIDNVKGRCLTVAEQIESGEREAELPFDEALQVDAEKIELILSRLPFVNKGKRSRKAEARWKYRRTANLVVANALAALGDGQPCYYPRGNTRYRGGGLYHPVWLSSDVLLEVVDGMEALGLLECVRADPNKDGKTPCSTFAATAKLIAWTREAGLYPSEVTYDPDAVCPIVLKAKEKRPSENARLGTDVKPKKKRKPRQQPIEFDPTTPERAEAIGTMHRINEFLRAQTLEEVLADGSINKPTMRALRRIFSNANWEQCGRHYCGWWQARRKEERRGILINGNPTVILDIQGYMPRALYHLQGIDYLEDPYDIVEIREAAFKEGLDWEIVRKGLKKAFQILTNSARDGNGLYTEQDKQGYYVPRELGLPQSISIREAFRLLIERHNIISEAGFFNQTCFPMMYLESQVCEGIILRGIEEGIVVLPVFDAFIVQEEHEEWLYKIIVEEYEKVFFFYPIIKVE